jgi:hypothetical protein
LINKDILALLVRVKRKFGIFYALAHGLLKALDFKRKRANFWHPSRLGWGGWIARDKSLLLTLFGPTLASAYFIRDRTLVLIAHPQAIKKSPDKRDFFYWLESSCNTRNDFALKL